MSAKDLQQCISDCQMVIGQLQSMTSQVSGTVAKSTLTESAHHLEMCVKECEFAMKQLP
ncbi:MAG: hypothetical protein ACYCX4_09595 [Bacillota bacterium]